MYKNVWKIIYKRGITWKLRKVDQSFLCMTCCPDLIHIPIKLHEDILNGYRIMEHTRMFTDGWTETFPSALTCYKDSRPCPAVGQYQLDALVT